MFKSNASQGEFNGFLDKGSKTEGTLSFAASFRIDGEFHGKVRSPGRLIVGEGASVDAEIQVAHLLVSGELRGTVEAAEQIQIAPGGRLLADITTPSLVIEDGAIFEGRCAMTGRGAAVPAAGSAPASPTASPAQGSLPKLVARGES